MKNIIFIISILTFTLNSIAQVSVSDASEHQVDGSNYTYNLNATSCGTVDAGSVQLVFDVYSSKKEGALIRLCAPDGTTCATIHDGTNTGDLGNLSGSGYDGAYTICDGCGGGTIESIGNVDAPPGSYDPQTVFSVFDGIPGNGTWTLYIEEQGASFGIVSMRNVTLTFDEICCLSNPGTLSK